MIIIIISSTTSIVRDGSFGPRITEEAKCGTHTHAAPKHETLDGDPGSAVWWGMWSLCTRNDGTVFGRQNITTLLLLLLLQRMDESSYYYSLSLLTMRGRRPTGVGALVGSA